MSVQTWDNAQVGISDTPNTDRLRDAPSVADTSRRGILRSGGISSMDGCIEWQGARDNKGYGRMPVEQSTGWLAHRWAWAQTNGPIPDGLWVLHRCDNPPCVNPDHLFLGTQADNVADMVAKGRQRGGRASGERNGSRTHPERQARGSRHGFAKLTETDILDIRGRAAAGESLVSIAGDYEVTSDNIGMVARGNTWTHVPGPVTRGHIGARPGEVNPAAKLTADMVATIRARVAGGELHKDVAAAYGVSKSLVGAIAARQVWKHVA